MPVVSTTNAIGFTYASLAQDSLATITSTMDAVIRAEAAYVTPTLRAVALLFVLRQFLLLNTGHMTWERFTSSCLRVLIVIYLVTNSGNYVQRIRDPLFNNVPQAISQSVLSGGDISTSSTTSLAAQFDQVSMASDAVTAKVVKKATIWDPSTIGQAFSAWIADGGMQTILSVIATIWLLGQRALAVILCFGPYLLLFELFDRTRGFVDHWIGKLVGVTAFGMGTAIVLAMEMTSLQQVLTNANNSVPAMMGDEATSVLWHVVSNMLSDAVTILALPVICAFGTGVAAAYAGPAVGAAISGGTSLARTTIAGARQSWSGRRTRGLSKNEVFGR